MAVTMYPRYRTVDHNTLRDCATYALHVTSQTEASILLVLNILKEATNYEHLRFFHNIKIKQEKIACKRCHLVDNLFHTQDNILII